MPFSFKMWQFLALWTVNAHPLNIFVMRFPLNIPSKLCEIKVVYAVVYVICNKPFTVFAKCKTTTAQPAIEKEMNSEKGLGTKLKIHLFCFHDVKHFILSSAVLQLLFPRACKSLRCIYVRFGGDI